MLSPYFPPTKPQSTSHTYYTKAISERTQTQKMTNSVFLRILPTVFLLGLISAVACKPEEVIPVLPIFLFHCLLLQSFGFNRQSSNDICIFLLLSHKFLQCSSLTMTFFFFFFSTYHRNLSLYSIIRLLGKAYRYFSTTQINITEKLPLLLASSKKNSLKRYTTRYKHMLPFITTISIE